MDPHVPLYKVNAVGLDSLQNASYPMTISMLPLSSTDETKGGKKWLAFRPQVSEGKKAVTLTHKSQTGHQILYFKLQFYFWAKLVI